MVKEDGSRRMDIVLDINTAVEELHRFSAHEMKKILRDSHCLTFRLSSGRGAFVSVDIEKLAAFLPLHLLACVASSISQPRFRYLLRGVRLLHSLSSLAPRYPKLEQILLQEVKIREQIIDLVIFMLIVLADVEPDGRWGSFLAVLHSALVACCLYLLTAFITPEWRDVVPVLLAHPKVDIFMDAAFDAVRRDVGLLQGRFRALSAKLAKEKTPTLCAAEQVSSTTLQQCEASLQVLQSLCEPQAFRDRLLNHKELCRNGGILSLVLVVLQLQLPTHLQHIQSLAAAISRLKSKVLAMLLKFCETETVSFLDEVATDARSMHIAKLVAGEIVSLVKGAFFETFSLQLLQDDVDKCPTGVLYLNSMRLADVLSDDSNFRKYFMERIAPDLATILAMDPLDFRSKWCAGCSAQDMADCEVDAVLVYDPFHGSGAAMLSFKASASSSDQAKSGCSLSIKPVEPTYYAQELSALLVKLFANLHCFNPEVCQADEKDQFLCLFMHALTSGPLSPSSSSFFMTPDQTAVRVCENLHILVDHVASLSADLANDEDVQLASVFAAELHEAFCLSQESHTEAPVIAYVRDAHEQRLRGIVARRQQSERWQRLQRHAESCEMEQTNAACATQTTFAHETALQEAATIHIPEEASSAVDNKADADVDTKVKLQEDDGQQSEAVQVSIKGSLTEEECVSTRKFDIKDSVMKVEYDDVVIKAESDSAAGKENYDNEVRKDPDDAQECDATVAKLEHDEAITEAECAPAAQQERENVVARSESGTPYLEETVFKEVPQELGMGGNFQIERFPSEPHANSSLERTVQAHNLIEEQIPMDFSYKRVATPAEVESEKKKLDEERTSTVRKFEDDGRTEQTEERQPKKRQRRIMSEEQISIMEEALKDEPEMQRYPDLVQHWTNALNKIGPELSCNQLKNWINNRKAKLAKLAKEGRIDPISFSEKIHRTRACYTSTSVGSHEDTVIEDEALRESIKAGRHFTLPRQATVSRGAAFAETKVNLETSFVSTVHKVGQTVVLRDEAGRDVAVGVIQAISPGEKGTGDVCFVEIHELKVDRSTKLPIGSEFMGTTFEEAEIKLGKLIVVWQLNDVHQTETLG